MPTEPPDVRGEGPEVEAMHAPLVRELPEPTEGREPAPWWLVALVAVALFTGGFYLGRHGGPFSAEPHADEGWRRPPPEVQRAEATPPDGAQIYQARCVACHQADLKGLPGAFPPLVGSEWVAGDPDALARIVLGGLSGPVDVAGATWNGAMPAWGAQLTDAEIAAVLTWVREQAGVPDAAVSSDRVAAIRAATMDRTTPWTAPELRGGE